MRMGAGLVRITAGRKVKKGIMNTLRFIYFYCQKQGDKWAYSFDVVHDIPGLIRYRGGNLKFIESLDDHFNGGHNDHSNEVRVDFQSLKNSAKIFFNFLHAIITAVASYSLSVFTCWGSL